jgi:hypothetical protein
LPIAEIKPIKNRQQQMLRETVEDRFISYRREYYQIRGEKLCAGFLISLFDRHTSLISVVNFPSNSSDN